jgi:membrane fusion protein (multidrug efflux system)
MATLSAGSEALAEMPLPVASVTTIVVSDTSLNSEFIGVEAKNAVDIRARVDGFLEKRPFNEGQIVAEGQDLFAIERAALEIVLTAAQARLGDAAGCGRTAAARPVSSNYAAGSPGHGQLSRR